jgi:hypothetical protein
MISILPTKKKGQNGEQDTTMKWMMWPFSVRAITWNQGKSTVRRMMGQPHRPLRANQEYDNRQLER